MIDALPHESVKNLIYKKGLANLLPQKVRTIVKENIEDDPGVLKINGVNDAASHSGSTKSDDATKNYQRERMFSFDESEAESTTHLKKHKIAAESFSNNLQKNGTLGKSSFCANAIEETKEV